MDEANPRAPRIARLAWGQIEIDGHPPFKDAKIFPGGAREWDWRETGTRHVPGIQPDLVQELIDRGAKAGLGVGKRFRRRSDVVTRTKRLTPAHTGTHSAARWALFIR